MDILHTMDSLTYGPPWTFYWSPPPVAPLSLSMYLLNAPPINLIKYLTKWNSNFRQNWLTCSANFCVKNFSTWRNLNPDPTIKTVVYIFFFISSVGHASILFKMAWSRPKSKLPEDSLVWLVDFGLMFESSLMMSSSSSSTWELSGSPWASPAVCSPA